MPAYAVVAAWTLSLSVALAAATLGVAAAGAAADPKQPKQPKLPPLPALPNLPGISCTVRGSAGPNVIRSKPKPEIICGRGGNDRIYAGRGDIVLAGDGNDTIYSRNGSANVLNGGPGRDSARLDPRMDVRASVEVLLR